MSMSRIVLVAAALIAAVSSVRAADLPYGSRAPYTVNQPLNMYSWAGPYIGGNIGWDWGSVDNNPTKPSGFVGGAQAGYNWQTGHRGSRLWGVERADVRRSYRDAYQCRLDRGVRRRSRSGAELERQGRVSLCRSERQQLHDHRSPERLSFRPAARRRQLSLLRP